MAKAKKAKEADFFNVETKIKYEEEVRPIMLEKYMLEMTVDEVKRGLLKLSILDWIKDPPEKLGLFLELPPRIKDETSHVKELQGHRIFGEFRDDFSRILSLKLIKLH